MFFSKKFPYLWIMKNENDMEMILSKYGFKKSEEEDTWINEGWEIRIYGTLVEISENPDLVDKPRYYLGDINIIDMETILEEISN